MSDDPAKKILYEIDLPNRIEWPGKRVAVARFIGCNMRCLYCYDADIVLAQNGRYSVAELYLELQKKRDTLDGVILSGGEATIHDLVPICREIKKMDLDIRLDTNGLNPVQLKKLLAEDLLDFVALDFKADDRKFGFITGSSRYRLFVESLELLIRSDIAYEVRTTVHPDLLTPADLKCMAKFLKDKGYRKTYYLNHFVATPINLGNLKPAERPLVPDIAVDTPPIVWR